MWAKVSKSANSSLGESAGWVSDWPLVWMISVATVLRLLRSAHCLSMGVPSEVRGAYIRLFETLPLCGIEKFSCPIRRWTS